MRKFIYERIYDKLEKILPEGWENIEPGSALKLKADQFMDFNFDVLNSETRNNGIELTIALSHYWKHQSGDMMADPDMEVRVWPKHRMAEALTFQQDGLPYPLYQQVYPKPGLANLKLKKQLNTFLNQWLGNVIKQGHTVIEDAEAVA